MSTQHPSDSSNALVPSSKRRASNSTALMRPPPAPKRIKRPAVVLDEDTYTSTISHIIRRDYFPGLAETDAQQEYLTALESKDKAWIREAGEGLTKLMGNAASGRDGVARRTRFNYHDGGQTPKSWGSDTPLSSVAVSGGRKGGGELQQEEEEGLGKLDPKDRDMSLAAFQAKYTSEDQESFSQILDRQNAKRFEKHQAWLHSGGNRHPSKQRLAQQKVLESASSSSSAAEREHALILKEGDKDAISRPAAPNTHPHTAFNSLMFRPDSIDSWGASTQAQKSADASLAPPKRVVYSNTRLPTHSNSSDNSHRRPPSPTMSSVRDAISGHPRLSASEAGGPGEGAETPRVNGYKFVDARAPHSSDSDHDHDDEEEEEQKDRDLLAKIKAQAGGSGKAGFRIDDASRREKLHWGMVAKISAARGGGGVVPAATSSSSSSSFSSSASSAASLNPLRPGQTPRFASAPTPAAGSLRSNKKHLGSLTPAAQRLFERVGGGGGGGSGSMPRGGVGGGEGDSVKARKEWKTPMPTPKRRKA